MVPYNCCDSHTSKRVLLPTQLTPNKSRQTWSHTQFPTDFRGFNKLSEEPLVMYNRDPILSVKTYTHPRQGQRKIHLKRHPIVKPMMP